MRQASLRDFGERKIIEEILHPRYSSSTENFGDDCAYLQTPNDEYAVVTTDPCPHPMADLLGFRDYYYWGWLLSTINLSDLAAAGAKPAGLLTSLVLPSDFPVQTFQRLLDGIDECCQAVGTNVIGGNLKEGSEIALTGTAIGFCDSLPMSRSGAEPNDSLLVIGDLGHFWAGYFALTKNLSLPENYRQMLLRNILTPRPKVNVAIELRRSGLMHACMDNSDGLYPSLTILARANRLGIQLNFDDVRFSAPVNAVAHELDVDPIRFALGWGDWQLVGAVATDKVPDVKAICSRHDLQVFTIGAFYEGDGVNLCRNGRSGLLMPLDSQRFTVESWFETGVNTYAEFMLDTNLLS